MTEDDPIGSTVADRALQIATVLSAELAAAHGLFGPSEVDAYRPDADVAATFAARRRAFLERIFGAMRVDREPQR